MTSKEYQYYEGLKKKLKQSSDDDESIQLMHQIYVFETSHNLKNTQLPTITK